MNRRKLIIAVAIGLGAAVAFITAAAAMQLDVAALLGLKAPARAPGSPDAPNALTTVSSSYAGHVDLMWAAQGVYSDALTAPTTTTQRLGSIDLGFMLDCTGTNLTGYVDLSNTLVFSGAHVITPTQVVTTALLVGPKVTGACAFANVRFESEKVSMVTEAGRQVWRQFRMIVTQTLATELMGEYRETLWNYGPQPFTIVGVFTLDRQWGDGVPHNDAPSLAHIANQTTSEDVAKTVAFTVADLQTPAVSLTLSAESSNATLVPTNSVIFGGVGTSRTMTITPALNLYGTSVITISVSDGWVSSSDSFTLTVTAVNDTPVISHIPDKTVNEDTPTGPITFTVSDAETPATALMVTAASGNLALVPLANMSFGGSGVTRTVWITPVANQNGMARITVTVSDGAASAGEPFTLTVNAVNDAPTISDIANRTINQDTSTGSIAFTVGDAETAAASLAVTATSSNLTLVPLAAIKFGGSGVSRTVWITPAAGLYGTARITVTVSDGALSASDTFTLTVNGRPTISNIPDKTVNEDTPTGPITFTIGDPETAASALTLTQASNNTALVPLSNIKFGGSGVTRTVWVTPALNQSGVAIIAVYVSDGSLVASDAFTLTVIAVNDPPVANAGPDLNVSTNMTVTLDGRGSTDVEGPLQAYRWTQTGGTVVTFMPNLSVTKFTAPPDPAVLTFTLTVTDNGGLTLTDSVKVTVADVPISGLSAVNDSPTELGMATQFTASVSGGSSVDYDWSFGDGQVGSGANVAHTYAAIGTYTARVTATNGMGSAFTSTAVTIVIPHYPLEIDTDGDGCGTVEPAVGAYSYLSGTVVPLTATACADSAFVGWSGSLAGVQNPTSLLMNAPKAITATFKITVTDLSVSQDVLRQQGGITFTIVVNNAGPGDASGTVLSSVTSGGMTVVGGLRCAGAAGGATCPVTGLAPELELAAAVTYSATLGVLPAGGVITFTLGGTAGPGLVGNTVTLSMPAGFVDTAPDDNTVTSASGAQIYVPVIRKS
jgi:uncharacterized repeat protein (TIGR01451 family)